MRRRVGPAWWLGRPRPRELLCVFCSLPRLLIMFSTLSLCYDTHHSRVLLPFTLVFALGRLYLPFGWFLSAKPFFCYRLLCARSRFCPPLPIFTCLEDAGSFIAFERASVRRMQRQQRERFAGFLFPRFLPLCVFFSFLEAWRATKQVVDIIDGSIGEAVPKVPRRGCCRVSRKW